MPELRTCAAITSQGQRCERVVNGDATYCYSHSPENAERRRAAASKAARAKGPDGEVGQVRSRLKQLGEDVLAGKVEKSAASIAAQVWGVYLRACETEMKRREQLEFEERLAQLEADSARERVS